MRGAYFDNSGLGLGIAFNILSRIMFLAFWACSIDFFNISTENDPENAILTSEQIKAMRLELLRIVAPTEYFADMTDVQVIEALRAKVKPEKTDIRTAESFLAEVAGSVAESYEPPGLGVGVHIEGKDLLGNVLFVDESPMHVSMFARV